MEVPYTCLCGVEFTASDNAEAPIPRPPKTLHDDEGRWVGDLCPRCDRDLPDPADLLAAGAAASRREADRAADLAQSTAQERRAFA